ncbi:MAG: 3-mercaptopyruvate sulfurtransferase [Roseovarius sp.]|nr:3-mercaptopyruvate sulfurtransferase [Roseovarius sp.]MCY4317062.1 3-mercaptopyruvate sulfurtransferase [Roseovarius sp.]
MEDSMQYENPGTIVSTEWLFSHLDNPDLRILDGTWFLPGVERDAKAEYDKAHIPGARFFDIDHISDDSSCLPHMAPPYEKFVSRMLAMGVGDGHQIVVYDSHGLFSSARVWWLFRHMGHTQIAVLDGGMPKWISEGRPLEDMPPRATRRHMTARRQAHMVKSRSQVLSASNSGAFEILDARSPGRFLGSETEPRKGLRSGRIPGSKNVFHLDLLNDNGTMKTPDELRDIFADAGVDMSKPAITTCGSGITAAIVNLALERTGKTDHALYDGSWTEWGKDSELPIEKGER